jgi:hypothetical protein
MDAHGTLMRNKKMSEKMSIADALRELERIDELLDQRTHEIRKYCSKKSGAKDSIEGQENYVKERVQSADDLITRYRDIKLEINRANLDTPFLFNEETYTIATAILYKHSLKNMYTKLYNSFDDSSARREISEFRLSGLTDEQLVKLDLVPQLFYDPKAIQKKKEDLLTLMSHLDSLIDKANHNTEITV